MANLDDRIIALIDMDCFFCQVEAREQPELKGKPIVVTQFNLILAVNYEARALGINRFGRGTDVKEKYPDVYVISVPIERGKGDVSKYRAAGDEVIEILKNHCPITERASVDEAYLDITRLVDERINNINCTSNNIISCLNNTFVVGYCNDDNNDDKRKKGINKWIEMSFNNFGDIHDRRLAIGGIIIEELRTEIYNKCEFKCSAGVSYNKVLAKLACGLHKPNKQTILPAASVPELFSSLPINKIRNLGGKIGKAINDNLKCNVMADLLQFSLDKLQMHFDDKIGLWLYNIARGDDNEPVISRLISKSIGARKNFTGNQAIVDIDVLKQWVDILATDVSNRLQQDLVINNRRATTITISYQIYRDNKTISQSRSLPLISYKSEKIINQSLNILKSLNKPIAALSIAASKFIAVENDANFANYFKVNGLKREEKDIDNDNISIHDNVDDNINNIEEIQKVTFKNIEIYDGNAVAIDDKNDLVQLHEIFPDLNNIDLSIVELLPIELQHEAQKYIESNNNTAQLLSSSNNNLTIKNTQRKSVKSISNQRPKNTIQNFLIKKNTDESSLVCCTHCKQMIEKEKYLEHTDFHIAHDLQMRINQSLNSEMLQSSSKRNREKKTSPKSIKKSKGIESYFSK